MAELNKYDKEHLRKLKAIEKEIAKIYDLACKEAAAIGGSIHDFNPDRPFSFADYPATKTRIDRTVKWLEKNVEATVVNGVKAGWDLANKKNDELCSRVFGGNKNRLTDEQQRRYFNNNADALDAFLKRKNAGLNLSDRVWNYTNQFKSEIEMGLDLGIRDGVPAAEMARDLKQYLKYPDKLFRRVRDAHGQLHLSKAAKAFPPGAGVYRSSFKNARRLAATETNIAYRSSDHERWQQLSFVVGVEVRLSNNHTINGVAFTDMCDDLKGKYPKTFKFTGWHPLCRCHAISVLKSDAEMLEENLAILEGREPEASSVNEVTEIPEGFRSWVEKNQKRIEKAETKGLPYFLKDNRRYWDKANDGYLNRTDKKAVVIQGGFSANSVKISDAEHDRILSNISRLSNKHVIFDRRMPAVELTDTLDGGVMMEWDNGVLRISTNEYDLGKGVGYCPARELASAFEGLVNGKALSFLEEYSIEALYHENLHSESKGIVKILKGSRQEKIQETCTQLYAREKYAKILRAYNKRKPLHFEKIKTDGLGYKRNCDSLRDLFSKDGKIQVGELINIVNESDEGLKIVMEKLRVKNFSPNEIEEFLKRLR